MTDTIRFSHFTELISQLLYDWDSKYLLHYIDMQLITTIIEFNINTSHFCIYEMSIHIINWSIFTKHTNILVGIFD